MILADTSAWIEYHRGTDSPVHRRLRTAIQTGEALATTGIVVFEMLAGARDERHARDLRRLLARCRFLKLDEPYSQPFCAQWAFMGRRLSNDDGG